jgi:hypothetical protein
MLVLQYERKDMRLTDAKALTLYFMGKKGRLRSILSKWNGYHEPGRASADPGVYQYYNVVVASSVKCVFTKLMKRAHIFKIQTTSYGSRLSWNIR